MGCGDRDTGAVIEGHATVPSGARTAQRATAVEGVLGAETENMWSVIAMLRGRWWAPREKASTALP